MKQVSLIPVLEANQGLISMVLFLFVFAVLIAQAKRAKVAEARAAKAERERRQDAEAIQEALVRFQNESLARDRASQEHAERERQKNQLRQFVGTANGLISSVLHLLEADQKRVDAEPGLELARPTQIVKRQTNIVGSSLMGMLGGAPMDPALIAFTRETALILDVLAKTPPMLAEQADKMTIDFTGLLGGALHTMLAQEKRILGDLGLGAPSASASAG